MGPDWLPNSSLLRLGKPSETSLINRDTAPYHLEVFEPGLLTHLPRERIIVPGPTACACCGSTKLGEDVTETLEVVTTPGAYEYFCSLHPHMTGAIVVEAATGSKAAQ